MKKIFLLAAAALALGTAQAQTTLSCCARPATASATEAFALLANNQEFVGGHDAPLPFTYTGEGKMVEFKTPDGNSGMAFEIKSAKPSNKYLLVYQEWWGLNDYIKQEAARYAQELPGVNVLAVDLYDGKVAEVPEEAGQIMKSTKTSRLEAIIKGAQLYAGPKAQFASVGWCFGGGWSLQSALIGGKQTVGCVMYYGMPEKDVAKLKTLKTDVLGLFAEEDKSITPEVVAQFEKDMAAAGKQVTVKEYPAAHAFANPSNPKYDKKLAEDAHQRALTYLKARLKVS